MAEAMASFVGVAVKDKKPQVTVGGSGPGRAPAIRSYMAVLRGEEAETEGARSEKRKLVRISLAFDGERAGGRLKIII